MHPSTRFLISPGTGILGLLDCGCSLFGLPDLRGLLGRHCHRVGPVHFGASLVDDVEVRPHRLVELQVVEAEVDGDADEVDDQQNTEDKGPSPRGGTRRREQLVVLPQVADCA